MTRAPVARERPIIFSGPMVEAIIAGRKTMTRRLATSPFAKCRVGDRLFAAPSITLWVTGVKCERLQDITREDALAEGVDGGCGPGYDAALHAFMLLWNSLHGPGAWDANPEVVCISFQHDRDAAGAP